MVGSEQVVEALRKLHPELSRRPLMVGSELFLWFITSPDPTKVAVPSLVGSELVSVFGNMSLPI